MTTSGTIKGSGSDRAQARALGVEGRASLNRRNSVWEEHVDRADWHPENCKDGLNLIIVVAGMICV
jgi:hypothetical protein